MRYLLLFFVALFPFCFALNAQQQPATIGPAIPGKQVTVRPGKTITPADADSIYQWRIQQEKLNGTYIPKDLYDCFRELDRAMDTATLVKFLAIPDSMVDARTHKTIGAWIAHRWELLAGSRITAYFNQMGVPHPEYMVSLILISYHRQKHGKDMDIKGQMTFYKAHWRKKQDEKAKKEKERLEELARQHGGK